MKAKRGLAWLLTLAMAVSMVPMSALAADEKAPAPAYGDMNGNWSEGSVNRWSGYGIIKGDDKGNFNPSKPLSRGELAQTMVNMMGLTEKAPNNYADLGNDEWYTDAVLKCTAAGIMQGDGVNSNAWKNVSREETMVVFGRAVGAKPDANPDMSKFTDGASVAPWAAGYMSALAEMGIVSGTGNGAVTPKADIDRASTMALLDKAVSDYVNAPGDYKVSNEKAFVVVNVAAKDGLVKLSGTTAGVVVAAGTAEAKVVANNLTAQSVKVDGAAAVSVEGASKVADLTANATGTITIASGVTVDKLSANAAGTVTNNGTIKELSANAAVKVENRGTITKADVKADGVVLGGVKPGSITVTEGTKNPVDGTGAEIKPVTPPVTPPAGGGQGETPVQPSEAIQNMQTYVVNDEASYNRLPASYLKLYPWAEGAPGFGLPWLVVTYNTIAASTNVDVAVTLGGEALTITEVDGTIGSPAATAGEHYFMYEMEMRAGSDHLGLAPTTKYGTYELTLTSTVGEKVETFTQQVDFLGEGTWFPVTYATANGDKTMQIKSGATFTVPAAIVKEGYYFNGYYTLGANGAKVPVTAATLTITAATHVYADLIAITAQNVSVREDTEADAGYVAGYQGVGTTLAGTKYTIDAATLEKYLAVAENSPTVEKLMHGPNMYLGIAFDVPAGAKSVDLFVDGVKNGLDSGPLGDANMVNGKYVSYFGIATPVGKTGEARTATFLEEKTWNINLKWLDAKGGIIAVTGTPLTRTTNMTVKLNSNNGVAATTETVVYGATVKTVPTRTGYTFAGWYNDAGLTTAHTTTTTNLELFAKWASATVVTPMSDAIHALYKAAPTVWTGIPATVAEFGNVAYTTPNADNKIVATGELQYITGFTGFDTSRPENQKGHYATFQFAVPNDVVKGEPIITRTQGSETITRTDSVLDTVAGVKYYSLILWIDSTTIAQKNDYTITIDWDGTTGTTIAPTTYSIDFSAVTCEAAPVVPETPPVTPAA